MKKKIQVLSFALGLIGFLALLHQVNASLPSVSSDSVYTQYSPNPVTSASPVPLFTSVPYSVSSIAVFDSSGQTMQLQINSGLRSTNLTIPPGGGGFPLAINQGASISLIGVSGNATSGINILSLFY